MASQDAEKQPGPPVRAAGGGSASEESGHATIASFPRGEPVLQHLRNVYENLGQGDSFQELTEVKDEEAFLAYMASPKSAAMGPPPAATRDLSYPLSSYYISSSHNTYLSGNQLYGEATTDAYTEVLQRRCRCLEIDVWDGEDSDTSASSSDEDYEAMASRSKAKPKPSRWSRMKAKAVQIRRSSHSRERSNLTPHGTSPPQKSDRLSPSTSPDQHLLKTEPRVLHGYTLTQSVPFPAVCHAIGESAFTATDLPLIVSLEVHANYDQQQVMVDIMKEAWKGHLVDLGPLEDGPKTLPSPESLRNKILIKVKWTPNSRTGESNDPAEQVATNTSETSTDASPGQVQASQKKAAKIIQDLSELGVYTRAYTFKQWDQPEAAIPTHVFSLSEGKVHAMHGDPSHGPALFDHNRNFLMRVFPKGTRIRSTNVDPAFHWRQGAQMVALNWQRLDKGMMLNEGMFAGQEGWVLKPEGYRADRSGDRSKPTALEATSHASAKQVLDLKIQLLSGQDIPLPVEKETTVAKIKPFVKIDVYTDTHGPPGQGGGDQPAKTKGGAYPDDEKEEKKYKFRSKTQRSDSPNFDGETAAWSGIPDVVEQLSFVRYVKLIFSLRLYFGKLSPMFRPCANV